MSLTLLQLITEFCTRRGLPAPVNVIQSQDDLLLQLVGLLNEVLEDLTTRYVGTALQKNATWAQLATESQGDLATLCPYGFKWIINDTFWDRTQRLPVLGPVNPSDWEGLKGSPATGVWLQYRIQEGKMLLNGQLAAGHTMALEYASDWAVKSSLGVYKPFFTIDSDTCIFPTSMLLAGLNWKYRNEKGLNYSEAFRSYEIAVTEFNGHDGAKPTLTMDGCGPVVRPGIFVPSGNWMK